MIGLSRALSTAIQRRSAWTLLTIFVLLLPACAPPSQGGPFTCALSSEKPMLVMELFFGRDIPGREPLTDAEWSDFAAHVVAKQFPDGFTAFNGEGQWRNPGTGEIVRERTKILIVAVAPSPDVKDKIDAVMSTYRRQYHQVSVGLISGLQCGAF